MNAYAVPMDALMRIGSSDITFKSPANGADVFRELNSQAGYELRCMTDQALFSSKKFFARFYSNIE